MSEEEYQKRIDNDPTVKRLSQRTIRERQKEGLSPEERNPRSAGRKREPLTASLPSVTMRIPGELADDIRDIIAIYRKDPDFARQQLRELACELKIYTGSQENRGSIF